MLYHTLKIKKWFIEKDEFDIAERRLLNYGHTWGHALESATNFLIPHGLAVAIGILASILFMKNLNIHKKLYEHLFEIIVPVLNKADINSFDESKFITAFNSDKKHSLNNYRLIVPTNDINYVLGVEELQIKRSAQNLNNILIAMQKTLNLIKERL